MKRFAFATLLVGLCWSSTASAQVYFQMGTYAPPSTYVVPGVPYTSTWNGTWANYNYHYAPYGGFYNYRFYNYGYFNPPTYYRTYNYPYQTWPTYFRGRGWRR